MTIINFDDIIGRKFNTITMFFLYLMKKFTLILII